MTIAGVSSQEQNMQKLGNGDMEPIKVSSGTLTRALVASVAKPFQRHICSWLTHSKAKSQGKTNKHNSLSMLIFRFRRLWKRLQVI